MSLRAGIKFGILGPVEIYDDSRHLWIQPNSPMQRDLLVALLVKDGAIVSSDTLVYELWGNYAPEKSANALQAHVTRLRRLLRLSEPDRTGPGRITTGINGYALQVAPAETDSWHFTSMTAKAKSMTGQDPVHAVELFRTALNLWRGTALESDTRGVISANKFRQLDEERLATMEALYDACLRANMQDQVVGELEATCLEYPFRERFYDQLMVALYQCDRQAEALGVYERARRTLVEELGLEPAPALTQRMQEILAHSPSLLSGWPREQISVLPRMEHRTPARQTAFTVPMPRPQPLENPVTAAEAAAGKQTELMRLRIIVDALTRTVGQLLRSASCSKCIHHSVCDHARPAAPDSASKHPAGSARSAETGEQPPMRRRVFAPLDE